MADYFFNKTMVLRPEKMHQWASRFFEACGMSRKDAACVADVLISADLRGVYSHGCMRIPMYCNRLLAGGTSASGQPQVIRQKAATAYVDGNNAMGQVVADYGMNLAINLAKEYGSSTVSVTRSNHLGTSAYYAMQAARQNMIGFVWTTGGENCLAPWGAKDSRLGNNPFAIAAPCATKPIVVLDMALSVVAKGKVVMARKTNSEIPASWALDKEGRPTTSAEEGYYGTMRPVGDYKGSGLAFANAILSAILSNSAFGDSITRIFEEPEKMQNTGQLFKAIDIAAICDVETFKQRLDNAVDYLKAADKTTGVEEIFVPGEIEERLEQKQRQEGIGYPVEVIDELRAYAEKLGVAALV